MMTEYVSFLSMPENKDQGNILISIRSLLTLINGVNLLMIHFIKLSTHCRNGSDTFQLRVARSTSGHLKQLIRNALEKTLNQCQQLRLLPSDIILSNSRVPRFNLYSRRRTGFEQIVEKRCSKLIDILIYAQQILC